MKKLFVPGLFLLVISQIGFAQEQPPMPGRGSMMPDSAQIVQMVDELAGKLTLTAQQKAQVLKIHQAHYAGMAQLRTAENLDREARRDKMRAMRDKMTEQIKALLNAEQVKAYDQYLEEQRSRRMMRPDGPPPGARP